MLLLGRIVLDEDVVVETVVPMEYYHETHHLRAMRDMIRGIALFLVTLHPECGAGPHVRDGAEAEVVNEGKMSGDALVQVYVCCDSPFAPRHPRLCGFARISVPAGEKKTVTLTLDKLTDTVVNEQGNREKAGKMTLYVGLSQPDEKSVSMCGVQPVVVEQ